MHLPIPNNLNIAAPDLLSRRRLSLVDVTWIALFVIVLGIIASRHELGVDEAIAWNIARSAVQPLQVIDIARLEGHTPFWYFLLWPLTLTGHPELMQALSIVLVACVAALLFRDQPWPRMVCLLVLFSYFVGYGYSIVSRPYGITLLLSAVLASSLYRGHVRWVPLCALCGLIAMTSAFGVLLSAAFMVMSLGLCWQRRELHWNRYWLSLLFGISAYLLLTLAAIAFIVLPIEERQFTQDVLSGARTGHLELSEALVHGVFPMAQRLPLGLGNWLFNTEPGFALLLGAAVLVVIAFLLHLAPWKTGQLAWLLAVAAITGGSWVSGLTAERYSGHLVLAALVLAWIRRGVLVTTDSALTKSAHITPDGNGLGAAAMQARMPSEQPLRSLVHRSSFVIVMATLVYHSFIWVAISGIDMSKDVDNARQISRYLDNHATEPYSILTMDGFDFAAVSAYLDKPLYDPDCSCFTRYHISQTRIADMDERTVLAHWCALENDGHNVVALIHDGHFTSNQNVVELARFMGSARFVEHELVVQRLADPDVACATEL